jgi:hypothetical protein
LTPFIDYIRHLHDTDPDWAFQKSLARSIVGIPAVVWAAWYILRRIKAPKVKGAFPVVMKNERQ